MSNDKFNVPNGWQLVPIEPSEEMYFAGYSVLREIHEGPFGGSPSVGHSGKVFKAMLSAAPQSAVAPVEPNWLETTRFLTDVTTAAGLLEHGKRDRGLAQRIGDFAHKYRTLSAATQPANENRADVMPALFREIPEENPGVRDFILAQAEKYFSIDNNWLGQQRAFFGPVSADHVLAFGNALLSSHKFMPPQPVEQAQDAPGLDERARAEQAYVVIAFDYASAPVGSRDWCLFWNGWQACLHPREAPAQDAQVIDERAAFAAWAEKQPGSTSEVMNQLFCDYAWEAWQARSALSERDK